MVGAYLDGELPGGEGTRVEEHLRGCGSCSALADNLRQLDELASRTLAPVPGVSAAEWGALWETIRRSSGGVAALRQPRRRLDWLLPVLSLAALLLLGAWLGMSLFDRSEPRTLEPDTVRIEELEEVNVIHFSG